MQNTDKEIEQDVEVRRMYIGRLTSFLPNKCSLNNARGPSFGNLNGYTRPNSTNENKVGGPNFGKLNNLLRPSLYVFFIRALAYKFKHWFFLIGIQNDMRNSKITFHCFEKILK